MAKILVGGEGIVSCGQGVREGVEVVGVQLVDLVRGKAPAAGDVPEGGDFVAGEGAVCRAKI